MTKKMTEQEYLKIKHNDKFIKLTASFRSEGQPDFEALNIEVTGEDMDSSEWLPKYFNVNHIESFNLNNEGSTNLNMVSGYLWSVKESPEEIMRKVLKNV